MADQTNFYENVRRIKRRESISKKNWVKVDHLEERRLQILEQDRDLAEKGLVAAQAVVGVYEARLQNAEKALVDPSSHQANVKTLAALDMEQERLGFEQETLRDLTERLECLSTGTRPPPPNAPVILQNQIERLKFQNKMLTEELGKKGVAITNLEQEKSVLIKQLFQAKSSLVAVVPPQQQGLGNPKTRYTQSLGSIAQNGQATALSVKPGSVLTNFL